MLYATQAREIGNWHLFISSLPIYKRAEWQDRASTTMAGPRGWYGMTAVLNEELMNALIAQSPGIDIL